MRTLLWGGIVPATYVGNTRRLLEYFLAEVGRTYLGPVFCSRWRPIRGQHRLRLVEIWI